MQQWILDLRNKTKLKKRIQGGCFTTAAPLGGAHIPSVPAMDDFGIKCDFDAVVECLEFLQNARKDDQIGKDDVIDSVENRLHMLMRRLVHKVVFPHVPCRTWPIFLEENP